MKRTWVISDLDGTLVETEQIWRDVRHDFTVRHGGTWRPDAAAAMIGMRTDEWARYIHCDLGVPLEPAEIRRQVVAAMVERLTQNVPVLPGADAALECLSSAFPLGLATSATPAVAHAVLEKTGWKKFFAVVVSADEVSHGKPAPDVYERALTLLGADPSRTAALEDSTNGILSAHNAGLAVIAIPNREFPPDSGALALAARVLSSLDGLGVETILEVL